MTPFQTSLSLYCMYQCFILRVYGQHRISTKTNFQLENHAKCWKICNKIRISLRKKRHRLQTLSPVFDFSLLWIQSQTQTLLPCQYDHMLEWVKITPQVKGTWPHVEGPKIVGWFSLSKSWEAYNVWWWKYRIANDEGWWCPHLRMSRNKLQDERCLDVPTSPCEKHCHYYKWHRFLSWLFNHNINELKYNLYGALSV